MRPNGCRFGPSQRSSATRPGFCRPCRRSCRSRVCRASCDWTGETGGGTDKRCELGIPWSSDSPSNGDFQLDSCFLFLVVGCRPADRHDRDRLRAESVSAPMRAAMRGSPAMQSTRPSLTWTPFGGCTRSGSRQRGRLRRWVQAGRSRRCWSVLVVHRRAGRCFRRLEGSIDAGYVQRMIEEHLSTPAEAGEVRRDSWTLVD